MTAQEAADKWDVSKSVVKKWCREKIIPGVYKVKMHRGMTWMLPDDAVPPPPGTGRKRGGHNSDTITPGKRMKARAAFIMQHAGTKSTRSIARALGISTDEVRSIYDRIYKHNFI